MRRPLFAEDTWTIRTIVEKGYLVVIKRFYGPISVIGKVLKVGDSKAVKKYEKRKDIKIEILAPGVYVVYKPFEKLVDLSQISAIDPELSWKIIEKGLVEDLAKDETKIEEFVKKKKNLLTNS